MKLKTAALFVLLAVIGTSLAWPKRIPLVPLFLKDPITINGAEVPAGSYVLRVESQGQTVQIMLWRHDQGAGQFVAAARGIWVKSGTTFTEDAFLVRLNPDGTRSLIEIRLGGTEKAIVLQSLDAVMKLSAK